MFSFLEDALFSFRLALLSKGRLRQMTTPLGIFVRELGHSISVQFYRDFFFVLGSLFSFIYCFVHICIKPFAMILCLVCVCLSITFVVRNIFLFYAHMAPTPLHTHWGIRPYTRVCVRYREWRSICAHAGSPTRLITVKPHLEFSFFNDVLSLIVPIATMYYLRGWYL